jgi:hypothetical protein
LGNILNNYKMFNPYRLLNLLKGYSNDNRKITHRDNRKVTHPQVR